MSADRWADEAEAFVRGFAERAAPAPLPDSTPSEPEPEPVAESWWCQHPQLSLPRARRDKHGLRHRRQCLSCGAAAGNAVSRANAERENGGPAAPFDEAFYERGRKREEAKRRALETAHEEKRTAWWRWYDSYLQSPQWREKRRLVLRRANGICEGCLAERAVHVHHKTYAHVGNELLFELAALCDGCHERVHDDNPNAPLAWMRQGPPT